MKLNPNKTSSRRKMRKAHFGATSVERRVRMSCALDANLKQKYKVNSIPVVKGDEVRVVSGSKKGTDGLVKAVYRKKYVIHIDKCTRDKANKQTVSLPIDASNCVITKLKLDKSRKLILSRKSRTSNGSAASGNVDNLAGVD